MPQDAGCLAEERMANENSSKVEPKRSHQWFRNTGEPEVFSSKNKKQAVEAFSGSPISGVSQINISPWDSNSRFHSVPGQFSDRVFGSELRDFNMVDKNMLSIGNGNLNMGRKDFENQYGNDDPSVGLSISHTIEDPSSCINFGGIGKVNQVRDSDNCMSSSLGNSYDRSDNGTISIGTGYHKNDGNISLGTTYNNGNNNFSTGTTLSKTDDNLVSVGHSHTFNKGDGSFMLMGHNYGRGNENVLSMSQPFDKGDGNFVSMGQSYENEDNNMVSLSSSYNKGRENFISMDSTYSKSGENFIIIADSSSLPVNHNHNKDEGSTISFGGFHDDTESIPSAGIISGYDLLMGNQTSDGQKILAESISELPVISNPNSNLRTDTMLKNKEPKITKKAPANNFPSNVKSLLSTGIFDGVPVKYVSGSRERNLRGIINGTRYLCSCDECKQSKALNAYEFERHAGAKTKHPNNHIYFDNGKTIYVVVQELKNTPQEMLFDAIQNVTGSTINQKNFRIWKASYRAATRELQRIYGKYEVIIPS